MADLIFDLETTGLDPFTDRIIAIGYIAMGKARILIGDERKIIEGFSKVLKKVSRVIGYNIVDFDIPFLQTRCIKHGVRISFPEPFDLAKVSMHRKRLEDWCRFLGIRRDFTLHGSQVLELFLSNKMDLIKKHCLDDLRATKAVWERYKRILP